jgi:hypothetical protein
MFVAKICFVASDIEAIACESLGPCRNSIVSTVRVVQSGEESRLAAKSRELGEERELIALAAREQKDERVRRAAVDRAEIDRRLQTSDRDQIVRRQHARAAARCVQERDAVGQRGAAHRLALEHSLGDELRRHRLGKSNLRHEGANDVGALGRPGDRHNDSRVDRIQQVGERWRRHALVDVVLQRAQRRRIEALHVDV